MDSPSSPNGKTRGVTDPKPVDSGQFTLVDAAALSPDETLVRLGSSQGGLSLEEVAARQRRYGPNALGTHRVRAASVLFRQLRNPILILLLLAALVSGLTGGGTNAAIIAAIVALSVGLSFFNEFRAEVAMSALRAKIHLDAEVRRDGTTGQVPVIELVPGDIVALRVGALVPADIRLLDVDELECDEAVLTGESMPVAKSAEATRAANRSTNRVRLHGHRRPPRVRHGRRGRHRRPHRLRGDRRRTHRKAGSDLLRGRALEVLAVAFLRRRLLTVFIFAINLILSRPVIDALLFSLAIAVGIAPEMMPAIVTVSLSAGSKASSRKKVLVKRLVAIEDLGNIEILFTDKTGTLTDGTITFEQHSTPTAETRRRPLSSDWSATRPPRRRQPVGGNALDQALWWVAGGDRRRADVAAEVAPTSDATPSRSTTSASSPRCS